MKNVEQIHNLRRTITRLRRLRYPLLAGLAICGFVVLRTHVLQSSAGEAPSASGQATALTAPSDSADLHPAKGEAEAPHSDDIPSKRSTEGLEKNPPETLPSEVGDEGGAVKPKVDAVDSSTQARNVETAAKVSDAGKKPSRPDGPELAPAQATTEPRKGKKEDEPRKVTEQTRQTQADGQKETAALTTPETSELWLINPPENGARVGIRVNGKVMFLEAGQRLKLSGEPVWRVEFHRGGDWGFADHSLRDGVHEFRVNARGWKLQPAPKAKTAVAAPSPEAEDAFAKASAR